MNEEQNKKSNTLLIVVIIIVAVVGVILGYFLLKTDNTQKPVEPGIEKPKGLYAMNKKELVSFTHKVCNGELKEISNSTVLINYPVFNGTDESIAALNTKIQDKVNAYLENYVLDSTEITEEDVKQSGEVCNFVIKTKDNKMTKSDYYEHLDYEVVENGNYLYIIEYFHLENVDGRVDTDVFNVYNLDKTTLKEVANQDVIKKQNIADAKNKIIKFVEEDTEKNYDYMDAATKTKFKNTLQDRLNKNEFKFYYVADGNMVFTFNEIDMWSTYELMYDVTNNTILIK